MTGFRVDDLGETVAILSCGHERHVRHDPPFDDRPWVLSEEGRRGKLGMLLECPPCHRLELPQAVQRYRRTPSFRQDTVPAGLCREHSTAQGVWGRIVVEEGALDYAIHGLARMFRLDPAHPGVIPPEVPHRLTITGPVCFHLEFLRRPDAGAPR